MYSTKVGVNALQEHIGTVLTVAFWALFIIAPFAFMYLLITDL